MDPTETTPLVTLALGSFLVSALATRLLIVVAPRLGLLDRPGDQKFHHRATPVGGGLAIFAALLPLLLLEATRTPATVLLLGGCGMLAAIGLADDRFGVSAMVKLGALLGLTTLLCSFGIAATTTSLPILDYLITVLWVTAVSSAFNAIDNMDGLATGVAVIAAFGFLIIALQTGQAALAGLSAALVGAGLGFLVFNLAPARIFMGDTGSFFLGFFLAILGVVGDWNENAVIAAIIPVLLLGVPLFDLAYTVLRRHQQGVTRTLLEAVKHCDTDHLSHRLVRLGLTPRQAVGLLYLISASFAISAVSLRTARAADGLLHLCQAAVVVAAFVPLFNLAEGSPLSPAPLPREGSNTADARAGTAGRALACLSAILGLALLSLLTGNP